MAKTPEELEKAQTDLGAAIADLQGKLEGLGKTDAENKKLAGEFSDLKAAFAKLTPKAQEQVTENQPGLFGFLDGFNPFAK